VIEELIGRMAALLEPMEAARDRRRYFHATYLRTTIAVAGEITRGRFADAEWVERWDVVFADLYLDALEAHLAGRTTSRPWAIAFGAPVGLPPLRHVLLGMNAHINYDLPQALVAVISDEQFDDPALLARRRADHQAIDEVLAARVAAEDDELTRLSGPGPLLDRLLRPASRLATKRFLREAREKVWARVKPSLRLLALIALHRLLDGLPQPILVRYGQIAPDEFHGLAFEGMHDGIDFAL
jgi:hypothetical protein